MTPGRVNGTAHRHIGTDTIFDDRSYVWDGANNKTQRVEKVGGVAVKTYDYAYGALNRMARSTKSLPSATPGTAGSWTGAMTLASTDPAAATFAGGDPLALSGAFSATFDTGTLQVFVSKVQGVRDEAVDYPATLQGHPPAADLRHTHPNRRSGHRAAESGHLRPLRERALRRDAGVLEPRADHLRPAGGGV